LGLLPVTSKSKTRHVISFWRSRDKMAKLELTQEYTQFQKDEFDPAEYARSITHPSVSLSSSQAQPTQDVFSTLAKLSFGVDHLNSQLHDIIASNYEDLLCHMRKMLDLEESQKPVRTYLDAVTLSMERYIHHQSDIIATNQGCAIRLKVLLKDPYSKLTNNLQTLSNVQQTAELVHTMVNVISMTKRIAFDPTRTGSTVLLAKQIKEIRSITTPSMKEIEVLKKEIERVQDIENNLIQFSNKLLADSLEAKVTTNHIFQPSLFIVEECR
jgi:hypothetical protein